MVTLNKRRRPTPRGRFSAMLSGLGMLAALFGMLPSALVAVTGQHIFWWAGVMLVIVAAGIETISGEWADTYTREEIKALSKRNIYRVFTCGFVPLQIIAFGVAGFMWGQSALSVADKLGLMVTTGIMGGFAINVAHELRHRPGKFESFMAKLALSVVLYSHFYSEHNWGHHVKVATPADPVSARYGESYYRFFWRAAIGEFKFAAEAERERLGRKGKRTWGLRNDIVQGWLLSLVLYGALIAAFGWQLLPYMLGQAFIAVAFLECINYIEHYGHLRDRRPDGRYERCTPKHAWNAGKIVTGLGIFNLQRHSDHHVHPGRRYQALELTDDASLLPGGYAQMVLLALIPPLWFRVMNPYVLALYDGDIRRVNLTDKLRAKHGYAGESELDTDDSDISVAA